MELLWFTWIVQGITLVVLAIVLRRLARNKAALKSRDDRLASVTHELRGPLQPIALAVSRLKREEALSPKGREAVQIIEKNLEAESRLVEDLLDASRGGRPLSIRTEPCDSNAIVQEVVEAARARASEKRLSLDLQLDPARPHALADPTRLRQIVRNLVDNAIKFTPSGGTVRVRSDGSEARHVALEVSDTGPGIPAAQQDRIFEPYTQLENGKSAGGLGLGLHLVRQLVSAQSGSVTVTSREAGQGATFTVLLPRAPAPVDGRRPASSGPLAPTRILLAEDHEDSARLIGELLASRGFSVTSVASLAQGLAEAGKTRFDVLISDLELPDGSGLDLMRRLRSSGEVSGIALSGRRTPADVADSRGAGFATHLLKPIDFDELLAAIAAHARRP